MSSLRGRQRLDNRCFRPHFRVKGIDLNDRDAELPSPRDLSHITETEATETESAETESAEDDSAWHAMVDAVPQGILYLSDDGTILRANLRARELIGDRSNLAALAHLEPWATAKRLYELTAASGIGDFMELTDPATDRTWEITVSPPQPAGGAVMVLRDITERAILESKLRRRDHLGVLGQLVYGISHKIRSNLFGITGLTDVIASRIEDDPEIASFLAMQHRQSRRTVDVLDRLMQYAGPTERQASTAPIRPLLETALAEATSACEPSKVDCRWLLAPNLPEVAMDREQLTIAFSHVLQNALEHSPEGGHIYLRGEITNQGGGDWLQIDIDDEGPGVAAQDVPKIFEPFFSRRAQGHGLGLSIARRIVDDHDGSIVARNLDDGGFRIRIRIPAQAEPSS